MKGYCQWEIFFCTAASYSGAARYDDGAAFFKSYKIVGFEWYAHRSSGREQSLIAFAGDICFYVWTKQINERGA